MTYSDEMYLLTRPFSSPSSTEILQTSAFPFCVKKKIIISAKSMIRAKIMWVARGFGGDPIACRRTSLQLHLCASNSLPRPRQSQRCPVPKLVGENISP